MHTDRGHKFIPWLIAAATLLVFGPLAFSEFTHWDDVFNIWQNPRLNPPTLGGVAWYWSHEANGLYIPLTYTVWAALAKVAYLSQPDELGVRLNPYVFHAANVALHAMTALLVYAILRPLVRRDWAAGVGALLFALHPVQVEPVGWAAGLKDVLCGCLSMLAIWLYLRFAAHDQPRGRTALYAGATLALVAAMLAKPTAMVVPAIAFVLHVWVMGSPPKRTLVSLVPWLVLSVACAAVAKWAQPAVGVPSVELWKRPFLAGDALAFYLYKLVLPLRLGIDYGWQPTVVAQRWWFWALWIAPVTLLAVLWVRRKRAPHPWAGAAIFVIGVAPVLGLTTFLFQYFSTVADHYLYIAMLGPALAAAWAVERFFGRTAILVAAAVLVALAARSLAQARHWRDDMALFGHAIDVNPHSFMAHRNLGYVHKLRGNLDRAESLLRQAIELKSDYWEARLDLAELLFAQGRDDEAARQAQLGIEQKAQQGKHPPGTIAADYIKLGDALLGLGRSDDAAEQYRRAGEVDAGVLDDARKKAAAATGPATSP